MVKGKLTDTKIRAIKDKGKYFDGGGLYLFVTVGGSRIWRIDYRYKGKYKTYTVGQYPTITLAQARQTLADIKVTLKSGIDPQAEKQAMKQAIIEEVQNTFENMALKWLDIKQADKTPKHRQDITSKLERFIYPTFRTRNINTITSKEILECIRKIEAKGLYETTKKTLGICGQIFSFAIGEGIVDINICAGLNKQLVNAPVRHYAFITDKKLFAQLLNDIDNYPHGILVKIALQIAPYVFLRPSELINATWQEIDLDNALWTIPEERMKLRHKHLVPLSSQVIKLLQGLHEVTGDTPYLFANWNKRNKPITIDGMRQGLRRMGYDKNTMTTHGFRHTASTMLNELGFNRDWIEKQLAHSEQNSVRATYNHAEYLPERRHMMHEWANYLGGLKESTKA